MRGGSGWLVIFDLLVVMGSLGLFSKLLCTSLLSHQLLSEFLLILLVLATLELIVQLSLSDLF